MLTKIVDGKTEIMSDEEEANVRLEWSSYTGPTYAQLRARDYPPIADQLDTIFHDGLDAWRAEIQAIKTKYPKPIA
tara:strand:+ start:221 stop:448 length:228 start_codon:yes stop_codon:yes gene_type:complete